MKALNQRMTVLQSTGRAACVIAGAAFLCATAFASPAPVQKSLLIHRHAGLRTTPPDSFLVYKVYSIDQLIDEVRSNPRIQNVYARHFHVPQSRVVEYMQANLVESYIPETRDYTCYCVRGNGLIYPIKQRFTQGTKVFALRNGEPVLKWVCGNPLSKFLPAVETHTIVKNIPVVKVAPMTEVIAPTDNVQILVPTETQFVATNSSSEFDTLVPNSIVGAAAPGPSNFVFVPSGGGGGLGALAFLPVLFAFHSNNSTPSSGGGTHTIPPVPEASTLESSAIMLAAGAVLLGLRRRAARRS